MNASCFQCDLDIPHVCYHGVPDARWGLHDGAIAALEAANRYLRSSQSSGSPGSRAPRTVKSPRLGDAAPTRSGRGLGGAKTRHAARNRGGA